MLIIEDLQDVLQGKQRHFPLMHGEGCITLFQNLLMTYYLHGTDPPIPKSTYELLFAWNRSAYTHHLSHTFVLVLYKRVNVYMLGNSKIYKLRLLK